MSDSFRIVRLLPELLSLNGSLGNAEVVAARLRWWGFSVEVVDCCRGESLSPSADLIVIGHGTSSMAKPASEALTLSRDALTELHREGAAVVGMGLGGDLLGREITVPSENTPREGIGLTDVDVSFSGHRFSGEVTGKDSRGESVAGYLNDAARRTSTSGKSLVTHLSSALGTWEGTTGPLADGILGERLWVSTLSGPLLSLNPGIADQIVEAVLARRGIALPRPTPQHRLVDESAAKARRAIELRVAQKR